MKNEQTNINCPKCGEEIDISATLQGQFESKYKKDFDRKVSEIEAKNKTERDEFVEDQKKFEEEKNNHAETITEQVKDELKRKESDLTAKIKKDVEEASSEASRIMQEEIADRTEKIKELNKTQVENEKLKREKEALKGELELENEKKLTEKLEEMRKRIQKDEQEKGELRERELHKQIDDNKKLVNEMKLKQEQGSMQLQGDVQETAIEDWLNGNFPHDTIVEIKPGAKGGDCLQIVNTHTKQNCGTIYYESKRTKAYQNSWIPKLKQDMRDKKADVGVLVTQTMPSDMERFGWRDGVWVCTYQDFKALCYVIREGIIKVSTAIVAQENKGDKMVLLYNYLTSPDFNMSLQGIVDARDAMKSDLAKEQKAMNKIWKRRETQIDLLGGCTIDMQMKIKTLSGDAYSPVGELESIASDESEEDEE